MKINTKAIILQGSVKDSEWSNKIAANLAKVEIPFIIYTASAHKTPEYLLSIIKKLEEVSSNCFVYVCVAGRSNALGGFVDANTAFPVINCPPPSEKYGGLDILSSLRMPTGIAAMTVLEPDQAALACAKILSIADKNLLVKIIAFQKNLKKEIISANKK